MPRVAHINSTFSTESEIAPITNPAYNVPPNWYEFDKPGPQNDPHSRYVVGTETLLVLVDQAAFDPQNFGFLNL